MKHTLLFLLILALAGCAGSPAGVGEPEPEAEPALPSLTPTLALVHVTPEALSPTPVAPTPTPEVSPSPTRQVTATPAPSFTPQPTPTPLASPTPDLPDFLANPPAREPSPGRVTHNKTYPPGAYEFIHDQFSVPAPPGRVPEEFVQALPGVPPGTCPLTGEPAASGAETRRPLNVRIDNSPQGRPQAGLENADVIWETLAEGGVTRLTVTFHCRTPGTLGPVRSARLIDLQLTPMLGAWLIHVGASQPVTDMIWSSPFAGRDVDEWAGDPAFYRINNAPVGWLSTYTNNDLIQGVIAQKDDGSAAPPIRGWLFSAATPPGSTGAATGIFIPYEGGSSYVTYRYDASTGRYWRYQGQNAYVTQRGTHLAMDNILVLFADETVTPIVEDSLGNRSLHYRLYGSGPALLFRDGQRWEATWRREGENVLVRVVDEAGNVIPLKPGQSAVQIVRSGMNVSWE